MKQFLAAAATAVAILTSVVFASPARATTVMEKAFSDLCREADMIFAGRVVGIESRWRDEKQKAIETVVTFAVDEAVFGVTGSQVQLSFAGGEMGGLREVIGGIPEFHTGEEVVLFASRKASISPVVGFNQGCFRIADGRVLNADRAPVTGVSGRGLSLGASSAGERGVPLAQFLGAVREQIAERPESRP